MEITFDQPVYLWTLVVIPVLVVIYFVSLRYSKVAALKFSNFVALSRVSGGIRETPNVFALLVRMLSLIFVILSISGMTVWTIGETSHKDYVLAIDASASMTTDDLYPNRLEVAKTAAINFIDGLSAGSYVGVLSFAGVSFVDQPLTQDKSLAKKAILNIEIRNIGGTDLGNSIITGTNLLIPSKKSRSIILLTDGRSNIGISKGSAINYAIDHHVVVTTIGIGLQGETDGFNLGIDEEELNDISSLTLGNSFLADNAEDLENIYSQLASRGLGNNPFNLSFLFLVISLVLLLTDWLLGNVFYKVIP